MINSSIHVTLARDNHTLKFVPQNGYRGVRYMAQSAILLKPHIGHVHIVHFGEK
jgi:hypothetical protein